MNTILKSLNHFFTHKFHKMQLIEIKQANAVKAYNTADANTKKVLEELLGKENVVSKNTMERFKTFDDVVASFTELSENQKILLSYNGLDNDMISASAYLKLVLISKALNEGWIPDWTNPNQRKYVPWFEHKSGFGLSYDGYDAWDSLRLSALAFAIKLRS